MDDIDTLIETLRALYAHLEKLKSIKGPELHVPGSIVQYQRTLTKIKYTEGNRCDKLRA